MDQYLFVYGTLKRGERNAPLLSRSCFVREDMTASATYALAEYGSHGSALTYPGLVRGASHVCGEIFAVSEPDLAALDRYVGHRFRREMCLMKGGDYAWAYMMVDPPTRSLARADHLLFDVIAAAFSWKGAPWPCPNGPDLSDPSTLPDIAGSPA